MICSIAGAISQSRSAGCCPVGTAEAEDRIQRRTSTEAFSYRVHLPCGADIVPAVPQMIQQNVRLRASSDPNAMVWDPTVVPALLPSDLTRSRVTCSLP